MMIPVMMEPSGIDAPPRAPSPLERSQFMSALFGSRML
jgi:hypothetical protein